MIKKEPEYEISIYDDITFASARLINILKIILEMDLEKFTDFESLYSIDFFACHPFLIFEPGQKEYLELAFYGYSENSLEYRNSRSLFANKREKSKAVFAFLISKKIIDCNFQNKQIQYILTDLGNNIARQFISDYFRAFQISTIYILNLIKKESNNKFRELQDIWINKISPIINY